VPIAAVFLIALAFTRSDRRIERIGIAVGRAELASVGAGILGGTFVSALVVSVAGARRLSEVFGWRHSLNERPSRQTACFYGCYAFAHIAGTLLVIFSVDLISLVVVLEVGVGVPVIGSL
jgi:hypothetical protein